MNILLIIGSLVVTLALASYSVAILHEQFTKTLSRITLIFITLGVILDIVATFLMIFGSPNTPFTLHGFLGYSALLVMLIDATLIWRTYIETGIDTKVKKSLHLYSRYAYSWWVIAYITGALLVILK